MYVRTPVTASSSPSSRGERWGWRRAGLRRGESGDGERGDWRRRRQTCTVCLLTLTSGSVSWATMVSELRSPLLGVGSVVIFFILAADADVWACHNFFWNEGCFPDLLEPIKQHLKNHKNMNNSYLDIQYLNKISTVTLVYPKYIYFVFTPPW
jgi:hypothetical protein